MKKLALFLSLILTISVFAATDKYEAELNQALNSFNEVKVKSLVDSKKVDLNKRDNLGWTQLEGNLAFNEYKKAEILLKYGANPNLKNKDGQTVLHFCSESDDTQCITLLLKYKVDVNIKDNNGRTPLYYALAKNNKKSVSLLQKNAAINDKTIVKETEKNALINVLVSLSNLAKNQYIDEYTRFDIASANGNTIDVHYTIFSKNNSSLKYLKTIDTLKGEKKENAKKILAELKSGIKDAYLENLCKNKIFANAKDEKLHYEYIYNIDDKKELFRFDLYPSECHK